MTTTQDDQQALKDEIAELEERLKQAKSQLSASCIPSQLLEPQISHDTALHTLLLLADSALPLGSFAFSSGLESYLAHHRPSSANTSQVPAFHTFLNLSLASLASTALPYALAGYRNPELIEDLDNDFDASTPCTVARRASVAQGRALLSVWDRSFRQHYVSADADVTVAVEALKAFQSLLRASTSTTLLPPNAHLAPLWGVLTRILGLPLQEAAYLFLFSHARTVTSAAVRASVLGPYQAQGVLARAELREGIRRLVNEMWERKVEDAGQSVPVVDLWVGRHEKLYSRIFNS
ncbi:hypothetical protein K490DRAFT_42938 [Saccharata proteae CBS 121410]|uniref:Urease accessory protein UreF n=1 Tax=Saccharata proteae CBS 121410 TaxID=1314787 RepID=A0A9P4LUX4_9PEZI|nr:hypothetical protein K490DRAFT_42938 [Saccharata proteae CBS 121410]